MFRRCKTNSAKTKPLARRKEGSANVAKPPPLPEDADDNVWERHETATHVFYYHVRTRTSTWTPPPPGATFLPVPPFPRGVGLVSPPPSAPARFLPTPPATPKARSFDSDYHPIDEEDRVKKSL